MKRNYTKKADKELIKQHMNTEYFPKLAVRPTEKEVVNYCNVTLSKNISTGLARGFINDYFGLYEGTHKLVKDVEVIDEPEAKRVSAKTIITDDVYQSILNTALEFYAENENHIELELRAYIYEKHGIFKDARLSRIICDANELRKKQVEDNKELIFKYFHDTYTVKGNKPTAPKAIDGVKTFVPLINLRMLGTLKTEYSKTIIVS